MRKLTITRAKSFVGCLGTMKVYIEDAVGGDTLICEVSCRKIGELKNGEEATFEIGEVAARIFVIADKLSADYCNDCYQLEAGSEDVRLTGRNKLNPAMGNPFRFDGNDGAAALAGRKKGLGKGITVTLCMIVIGLLLGYGLTRAIFAIIGAQEKTFTVGEMSITLTESFDDQIVFGYTAVYYSSDVDIFVNRDSFSDGNGDFSGFNATEYARYIIQSNDLGDTEVITEGSLSYFIFSGEASDGQQYRYYAYTYKSDGAYWLIQFAAKENRADKLANDIAEWASSVRFE